MSDQKKWKIPGSRNPAGDRAVVEWVREAYRVTGQLPNSASIVATKATHVSNIVMAGGLNQVLEFAVGKSYRTEILRAIVYLTTRECKGASANEITQKLAHSGIKCSVRSISANLREMHASGYVAPVLIGTASLWSITKCGSQFMIDQGRAIKEFKIACQN